MSVVTNPIIKFQQKPTRGNAIKAKCAECVGCSADHLEPGFRETIKYCTAKSCPIYIFRPFRPQ